jgi:uncharacterized membrane protein
VHPTQAGIATAPKGIMFDTELQARAAAIFIVQQAVTTRAMPPGNLTAISEEERAALGAWATAVARGLSPRN